MEKRPVRTFDKYILNRIECVCIALIACRVSLHPSCLYSFRFSISCEVHQVHSRIYGAVEMTVIYGIMFQILLNNPFVDTLVPPDLHDIVVGFAKDK